MHKCELCRKQGTKQNPTNKHHIRGKHFPEVMVVHSKTCHWFAQWITNSYVEMGRELELNANHLVYLYNRLTSVRDGGKPLMGW